MNFLGLVPLWVWALAAALAWGGWQYTRAERAGTALLESQAAVAQAREAALHGALVETTRRLSAQQEVGNVADRQRQAARTDAVAARSAVERLQRRAHALAADARACATPAPGLGASAPEPGVVLADMLGRVTTRAGELAAEADARGASGAECVGRYDALTKSARQ